MNMTVIDEALRRINAELMEAPVTNAELEGVRKALLLSVLFIEQMQIKKAA